MNFRNLLDTFTAGKLQTSVTEYVPGILPRESLAVWTGIVQYILTSKQEPALTEQQNNHWVSASLPPTPPFFLFCF